MLRFTGDVRRDGVERLQRGSVEAKALPWAATGACDVEQLLGWAVAVQKVGPAEGTRGLHRIEAEAMGMEWRGSSSDGCAAFERIAAVGCKIDVSQGAGSERVHAVADEVAAVLSVMPQGGLLFDYAKAGRRPENWREPRRWVRPESWVTPEQEAVWLHLDRRHGPRYCPVIISYSEEALKAGREEYQRWWEALQDAAWLLGLRGLPLKVTGPAAPMAPWENAQKRD